MLTLFSCRIFPQTRTLKLKAIDVLYRISTLAGKEKNPLLALEGILDEVMNTFGASSASISLLNADSDKLVIEVERGFIQVK